MNDFFVNVDEKGYLNLSVLLPELAGKRARVTVEKLKSKRSDPQNRYYWGTVVPIIREGLKDLGHRLTKEQTHQFLAARFLKESMANADDEFIGDRIKSTTELSKSEFADYIAQIQQFGAEYLNTIVPDPETQTNINLNQKP